MDYVFVSAAVLLEDRSSLVRAPSFSVEIEKNNVTDFMSDHYPVLITWSSSQLVNMW